MTDTLDAVRRAAARCTACELYGPATQTVFGSGPSSAWLMLVGEQPGDQEDRAGKPFVGPAGRLLDTVLERAGIDRDGVYVTNAVKHFRFERDGKRRIHKKPAVGHVRACRQWLDRELDVVPARVIATLGATAAQALLGPRFTITEERGRVREWEGHQLVATVHPSAILRTPSARRDDAIEAMVADLTVVAGLQRA